MNIIQSQADWLARAAEVLPGGGFGNFSNDIIIARGDRARVWDQDGKEYVDYLIGSGPMLLGHGHPEVMDVVLQQLPQGLTFFTNNTLGIELAEEIVRAVPCAEMVRFVSTGGEADMYAIRLARAFMGRDKMVKFEGGYHGMSAEAQMSLSPARQVNFPQAVPDSAGIPQSVADEMLIAPFNDLDYLASLLDEHGSEVAGIIMEPLQRVVPPEPGFLQGVRDLCDKHGILLIFDEIVTGFRLDYGGAQERWGVTPDIATLGKIIGGGFPLAATVGRADIMSHFDKAKVGADKWLMQLGTLSGNPIAAAAGLKTMEVLRRPGQYDQLKATGKRLMEAHDKALTEAGVDFRIVGDATLFDVVFAEGPIRNYRDTQRNDLGQLGAFNRVLRDKGILKAPTKLYPSLALTESDLTITEAAIEAAASAL
ncbi:aspartate aminotransferase family protein [Pelagovum pacificum]|uniref:Glutamate-1-semialdehyde 2,1-aminomutase n=1 Tax=Pelagovum pacificum TaxID=2588711 RepID=A0A5C5GG70_9RHOB|nr:aminotransferase class III-fold pyridoxal phosphate-dependent enzyme [Pelagovum pacificum]QQA43102.1 aminotransferase class III-fold pyridoxal phosphate-dependent enzyme [Pelagovum pacificum]TNY33755.1 aminotransferase class III-fold pyridoxal phosphate-dependent enzyme [Pelagovum pacificum]